jgi:carbonic anhydrase
MINNMKCLKYFAMAIAAGSGLIFAENMSAADWSYKGATGAKYWGRLGTDYQLCKQGKRQSPIDIEQIKNSNGKKVQFNYPVAIIGFKQDSHNLTFNIKKPEGNNLIIDKQPFTLQSLHLHTPSEHELKNVRYPMELHMVHKNAAGQLAVVGVWLKQGKENLALDTLFNFYSSNNVNGKADSAQREFAPMNILPKIHTYFSYSGSLTTPPCTEGVTWIVMQQPVEASAQQINFFKQHITAFNARPVQPLNQREVV